MNARQRRGTVETEIQGRTLSDTVRIGANGAYGGLSVHTPYPLEHADFLKITKVGTLLPIWAHTIASGAAIYLLTIASKWVAARWFRGSDTVSPAEWITLGVVALSAVIFEAIYFCAPSPRKETLREIQEHFNRNPPRPAAYE